MEVKELKEMFKLSKYKTAITKNMPDEVLYTVFNSCLEQDINPFLPIFQIAIETSGLPKLHVKTANSYNWFNITATKGQKYSEHLVPEYDSKGNLFYKHVKFRVFNSLQEATNEYISLIKRKYPNFNDINSKSLTNQYGASYASKDNEKKKNPNSKSYTELAIGATVDLMKKLNIKDYSISNLKRIFLSNKSVLNMVTNNIKKVKESIPSLKEKSPEMKLITRDKNKVGVESNKDKTRIEKDKSEIPVIDLGTKVIKKNIRKNTVSLADVKISSNVKKIHPTGDLKAYVKNGVYVTNEDSITILLINSTSMPFDEFIQLIIRGVSNEVNWQD